MKKVYLLLTAICLAALTGCIKEEPYTLETATLEVNLTRTEGDATESAGSQEQGDGIKDVMVWAFQCDANGVVEDEQQTAVGWRTEYNVDTYQSVSVHVPLPVCNDQQWYILVAVLNTSEFGTATFNSSTTYDQLKAMTFDASSRNFWKSYPNDTELNPEDMPVSNWAKFLLKNTNTHANNQCYTLNMPVYRAVAKTQLFVSKESNDYALEITGASVHAGSAPTKGFVLSATTDNREGANGEAAQIGNPEQSATPTWYGTFATTDMAAFSQSLKNTTTPAATEGGQPTYSFTAVSLPKPTEGVPNPDYTDVWAGSLFLYENAADGRVANYANYNYKANPTEVEGYNNHYYMQIDYKIDGKPYTGYVPLPAAVRNHDYQVYLTVEGGGKLDLTLKVNEWNVKTESHNYLNEVSVPQDGQIQWTSLPSGATNSNGVVTLGNAANLSATCKFFLNTPANGTWQAELVTVEGQEGAITFADGSTKASGAIAGQASPAELTIKTTRDNLAINGAVSENKVELRITATATVGGVKRTYKVTGLTGITGVDYFTIVQTR
ncbi:MAG: hypothetical protein J6P90_01975 [Rikenellaceae bacterium]|nr:hypothetical protein [Rikenellaceae bacterium]